MTRLAKGRIVEVQRDLPRSGLKAGDFGRIIASRKDRGVDAYYYDVDFGNGHVYYLYEALIYPGKHSIRDYYPEEDVWRCHFCKRKVKAPEPCSICGGYTFTALSRKHQQPFMCTFKGQRVCSSCRRTLPAKFKTDNAGNPLAKGDTVQIIGGPITYMGWFGRRGRVVRLGPKRARIIFADGVQMHWPYNDLQKAQKAITDSGSMEEGRRLGRALNRVFSEALRE